jgi:hypothetical protein
MVRVVGVSAAGPPGAADAPTASDKDNPAAPNAGKAFVRRFRVEASFVRNIAESSVVKARDVLSIYIALASISQCQSHDCSKLLEKRKMNAVAVLSFRSFPRRPSGTPWTTTVKALRS